MMWITAFLFIWFSTTQAGPCNSVHKDCWNNNPDSFTKCYEEKVATCITERFFTLYSGFHRQRVNSSQKAESSPTRQHRVYIPPSALQRSRGNTTEEEITVVASVINSSYFHLRPPQRKGRGFFFDQPVQGTVLKESVFFVSVGNVPVQDLQEPIKLIFNDSKQAENGTCVFWFESNNGAAYWSKYGCETNNSGEEYICSCNHLSFFAVLVNPVITMDKRNAVNLTYITYFGSGFSACFTFISLIIYICLHRRRPEKAMGVHMQLTGAMFCLHFSFLLCSFGLSLLSGMKDTLFCQILGLFLHWSLLATFSWAALEGFHLYLLLVQVFNIYVRRYLLKLSLFGWGLPSLVVAACGISGVYGKYSLKLRDDSNQNSTADICWMDRHQTLVSYITTVAYPLLVALFNTCMLGLVVFKLWQLRRERRSFGSNSNWKKMLKEKESGLWKDGVTVLGLSYVLGLPWWLISTTFASVTGIYAFTILNSLQGVFIFLWTLALTFKSRSNNNLSARDPSSQKMMTTSFK
ncbi:adhesion G protein-coupled receptor G3-like [Pholidichthys leucotaenia]